MNLNPLILFRALFGVKKCSTLAQLRAYIKPGDLAGLWNWIDWWIPYRDDKGAADEFRPVEEVIHRAAHGRGDDCDGIHLVPYAVIKDWPGWGVWLVVVSKPKPPQHLICIFERPDGVKGFINYGVYPCPGAKSWSEVLETVPGDWTEAVWVDEKGEELPKAGWKK